MCIATLNNCIHILIACRLNPSSPLSTPISLPASDTLKIIVTATEGKTGKRPHQAFLTFQEQNTGLEESFAFSLKNNGKGKVEVVRPTTND